jgi:hypothetical protein
MKISAKSVATSVAALAIALLASGQDGVASVPSASTVAAHVQPVATAAPLPQNPPPAPNASIPTSAQLTGILNNLADPGVPFANKSNLVEGGISGTEAHAADHQLKKAAKNGDLPLSFNVGNIQPGASGSATADVAVSGPKIPSPVTQNVTFVNQGGWVLSRSSAMTLLQAAAH